MNMGLVVLLLVGVILMTANNVKASKEKKGGKEKVVYKYLPFDIEEFYRQDAVRKPSKLYYSMFTDEDVKR